MPDTTPAYDPDATGAEVPLVAPEVAVPGYEILGVLGRGGMGVVYRARHLALKREVALKMILTGGHAGPRELARFRIEAEAVARLAHPNIVQIHEVGEAEGIPYCALEFVAGGTLATRLADGPLSAADAAKLVETLARAMQFAHSRNVVHRDLKPANVLLASDGTPKITDFGLARRLDSDSGETQAGQVMGTPSYMAPEQASGHGRDAGPAADVYALGAILYACLTGQPPFKGDTVAATLEQVRTQDPARPAGVPLDLATICLKCLQKDALHRYASAAELADELGRYQRGEPILARPVSKLQRAAKWVRRNPVVASLVAAVLLLLLAGISIAAVLAVVARAGEARALDDAAKLRQANERLLTSVARGLLRPLAVLGGNPVPPPTDAEIKPLWELAVTDTEALRTRFIEVALEDPILTRQLRDRAAFALHATVGLSLARRDQAEARFGGYLRAPATPAGQRVDVALCLADLGGGDRPLAAQAAETILEAMAATTDPHTLTPLAHGVAAAAARLEPAERSRLCGRAAAVFARLAPPSPSDLPSQRNLQALLTRGFTAVTPGLAAPEATEIAALLAGAIPRTRNSFVRDYLVECVKQVAPQLTSRAALEAVVPLVGEAAKTFDGVTLMSLGAALPTVVVRVGPGEAVELTRAFLTSRSPEQLRILTGRLDALASSLDPQDARAIAAQFEQAATRTTSGEMLQELALGLRAVARRLDSQEATDVCSRVAATLASALSRPSPRSVFTLAHGISVLARYLDAQTAARVATTFVQAIERTTAPATLSSWVHGLKAVAARLAPTDATAAVAPLVRVLGKATDASSARYLAEGVAALAASLEPAEAARACAAALPVLTNLLSKRPASEVDSLAYAIVAIAAYLEPQDAATALVELLAGTTNPRALHTLAHALAEATGRLAAPQAAEIAGRAITALTTLMSKSRDSMALQHLAQGIAELAERLTPAVAARVCGQAVATLTLAVGKRDTSDTYALVQGLIKVADYLDSKDAATATATLTRALADPANVTPLGYILPALAAVTVRLDPHEAAQACGPATDALCRVLTRLPHRTDVRHVVAGLTVVAAGLGPQDAAAAATLLTDALSSTQNAEELRILAQALPVVTARLAAADAATVHQRAAGILSQALTTATRPDALKSLAQSLSWLAARLEPEATARTFGQAADLLLDKMGTTTEPNALAWLAEGVASVTFHLPPQEGSRRCGQAAARLAEAMSKTQKGLFLLVQGLAAVAVRLEAEDTVRAAATIAQALARTEERLVREELAQGLLTVLRREPQLVARMRCRGTVSAVASLAGLGGPFVALGWPQPPPLRPLAPPLPVGTLVELLKQPFCVGEARRLILDQLGRHSDRHFADQWDFAEYAQQAQLDLDLAAPPRTLGPAVAVTR